MSQTAVRPGQAGDRHRRRRRSAWSSPRRCSSRWPSWSGCKLGSPVLFRQTAARARTSSVFTLVKFRTMLEPDEARGLVTDDQRLTRFGALLRSTSLDELPTLWNVLKGDMSLVGPRPLLVQYLDRYTAEQRRRHEVRPGITGLAQVSGRNALTWEEKFAKDVEYVDGRSPRARPVDHRPDGRPRRGSRRHLRRQRGSTMTEFCAVAPPQLNGEPVSMTPLRGRIRLPVVRARAGPPAGWIAQALRRQGASVEVLTGIPNYPTGQVADGYRAWRPQRDDESTGCHVRRTPLYPNHDVRARSADRSTTSSWAMSSTVFGAAGPCAPPMSPWSTRPRQPRRFPPW